MSGPASGGQSPVGSYASVVAMGPTDLDRGGETRLVIAWLLGDDPADLREAALRARVAWSGLEEGLDGRAPTRVRLLPSLPNPLVESGIIRFALPDGGPARIQVYDTRGREVATLVDAQLSPGFHRLSWSGRDHRGRRLANGVYHLRLSAGGGTDTRSVVLLRR